MIDGWYPDKAAEVIEFRQQYINAPFIENTPIVLGALGKSKSASELHTRLNYEYDDGRIQILGTALSRSDPIFISSISIYTRPDGVQVCVFRDEHYDRPDEPYVIIENCHYDEVGRYTLTTSDIIYRPGKWIDYINNELLPKAQQALSEIAAKEAEEEAKLARYEASKHLPIDDSDIFG